MASKLLGRNLGRQPAALLTLLTWSNLGWHPASYLGSRKFVCGLITLRHELALDGLVRCTGLSLNNWLTLIAVGKEIITEWSQWSNCSHQCFTGTLSRSKSTTKKYLNGESDVNTTREELYCNQQACSPTNSEFFHLFLLIVVSTDSEFWGFFSCGDGSKVNHCI